MSRSTGTQFSAHFPGLPVPPATRLTVEQRFIRSGQVGFVAGQAAPDVRAPESGYRGGAAPPVVVAAGVDIPLIVAACPRWRVFTYLMGPAFRHLSAALLALGVALSVFALNGVVASLVGL